MLGDIYEDGDQTCGCKSCGHHWYVEEEEGDGEGLECPECGSEDAHVCDPRDY